MQLELAFLEQPVVPDEGPKGPWDQIDPQAPYRRPGVFFAADCAKAGCKVGPGGRQ